MLFPRSFAPSFLCLHSHTRLLMAASSCQHKPCNCYVTRCLKKRATASTAATAAALRSTCEIKHQLQPESILADQHCALDSQLPPLRLQKSTFICRQPRSRVTGSETEKLQRSCYGPLTADTLNGCDSFRQDLPPQHLLSLYTLV